MTKWTYEDQRALEALLDRKSAHINSARSAVARVVELMFVTEMDGVIRGRIVSKLMDYAEQLRDALAPLDTGVRVQSRETE